MFGAQRFFEVPLCCALLDVAVQSLQRGKHGQPCGFSPENARAEYQACESCAGECLDISFAQAAFGADDEQSAFGRESDIAATLRAFRQKCEPKRPIVVEAAQPCFQ